MPLGREVGLGLSDTVLDGDPAPPPKKGHSLQFSAHVYCGQTAKCIRLPLGTEIGLSAQATLCNCLLYTSPSPRDRQKSRMPSSA